MVLSGVVVVWFVLEPVTLHSRHPMNDQLGAQKHILPHRLVQSLPQKRNNDVAFPSVLSIMGHEGKALILIQRVLNDFVTTTRTHR